MSNPTSTFSLPSPSQPQPARGGLSLPPGSIAQANAAAPLLTPSAMAGTSNNHLAQQLMYQAKLKAAGAAGQGAISGAAGVGQPAGISLQAISLPSSNGSSPGPRPMAVNQNGKRVLSPERPAAPNKALKVEEQSNGNVYRVTSPESGGAGAGAQGSPDRRPLPPMAKGTGIDLRAEEEAARRANSTRVGPSTAVRMPGSSAGSTSGGRGKHTDLFAPNFLRDRLALAARKRGHSLVVDDEAAQYLALAAEMRMRSVIASAVRAHDHRVGSSHARKAPLINTSVGASSSTVKVKQEIGADDEPVAGSTAKPSKKSKEKQGKALWNHVIRSSPAMVLSKLAEMNREDNKAHRVARTERNARETEMARIQAAASAAGGGGLGTDGGGEGASSPSASGPASGDREGSAPPTTPAGAGAADSADSPGASSKPDSGGAGSSSGSGAASRPAKEITFSAKPMFGAAPPRKSGGAGGSKQGRKAGSQVSAEVQHKMTNAVAMASTGRKRYNWETGAFKPQVPSLLSGKRKKGQGGGEEGDADAVGEPMEGAGPGATEGMVNGTAPSGESDPRPLVHVKPKPRPTPLPSRHNVKVDAAGKTVRDDAALTTVDLLFALEREGGGRGAGSADDVVTKVWSRWGGPWSA